MLDSEPSGEAGGGLPQPDAVTANDPTTATDATAPARRTRRRTTKAAPASETPPAAAEAGAPQPAGGAEAGEPGADPGGTPAVAEPARTRRRRATKAAPADEAAITPDSGVSTEIPPDVAEPAPRTRRRRAPAASAAAPPEPAAEPTAPADDQAQAAPAPTPTEEAAPARPRRGRPAPATVLFMPPTEVEEPAPPRRTRAARAEAAATRADAAPATREPAPAEPAPAEPAAADADQSGDAEAPARSRRRRGRRATEPEAAVPAVEEPVLDVEDTESTDADEADLDDDDDESPAARRRRRRGRRGRGRGRGGADDDEDGEGEEPAAAEVEAEEVEDDSEAGDQLTRRRRRRRRKGAADAEPASDEPHVVVKIREPRAARDEVQGVSGSTRLEAKRQRRRDGREQRRTRPPILSEAEFLARREAVDRVMIVRQKGERTQIAVLEDGVLVEHYVTRASAATLVGSVFLGRVQNVLPSMEAAFVDVGRGRNAVLYAGEVNWDATGLEGRTRTIEQALKSGDSVLVQVTKDPIGTKGARLTSHIALSGRHLVYVPHGNASGISRKLSDVERKRLRDVLKNLVPDGAGVIVRTAAEGASEDELARDVKRLQAQWETIQSKAGTVSAPNLLYEEPDLVIRVVRDLFNEDFKELVIQGTTAYEMVEPYLSHVSPDLVDRLRRYTGTGDVFAEMRVDEQLMKALDRKVYLPSGGSLVIDRTEAMTVIDVNTGKYTGAGGNLEETVTRNNLEAAEEIVRQLRLRDLGGILVIDFIDMVLESNRDLVLRRLTECLGRDRTKHQVTEITSLGLVQMTRKRVGQGLLEAFSENCEACKGRGLILHPEPVGDKRSSGTGDRAALAKVAAASTAPAEAEEGTRVGRRRGRRAAATVEAAPEETAVDIELEPVPGEEVAPVEDIDLGDVELDPDGVETGGELRRRARRGGTRRRTRP
jgi:ribonuclease E